MKIPMMGWMTIPPIIAMFCLSMGRTPNLLFKCVMICHGGLGFHFARQPHVISCNINDLTLTIVVFHILHAYTVYPRRKWLSLNGSVPQFPAPRSWHAVPGATSAPCAAWTELVTWMQRLQPGLAAKWMTKGPTMDLYIYLYFWVKTW